MTDAGALAQRDGVESTSMDDLTWLACVSGILMCFSWLARSSGFTSTRAAMESWRATATLLVGTCLAGLTLVQAGALITGQFPSDTALRSAFHLPALALAVHRWLPIAIPRTYPALGLVWLAPAALPADSSGAADIVASLIDPRSSSLEGWWIVGGLLLLGLPPRRHGR
ncbi:hypothetical protein Pla163_37660 [Planctomycetes bacterium Pla163]|uniref:Uncharacterized protein n=1 Tax=Rohdeia mirabilis TaxID=2528008 RepID=A0A518D560_9BACT|nr:hypothetical protein Pla163_37660 [Planctomycetes bacterium Pla163]